MREQTCFGVPCHGFDNEECNRNECCTAVVYVSSAILCPPVPSKPRQGPIEPSLLLKPLSQRAIRRQGCCVLMLLWRPFRLSTDYRYFFGLQSLCSHCPKRASATVSGTATFVKATVAAGKSLPGVSCIERVVKAVAALHLVRLRIQMRICVISQCA